MTYSTLSISNSVARMLSLKHEIGHHRCRHFCLLVRRYHRRREGMPLLPPRERMVRNHSVPSSTSPQCRAPSSLHPRPRSAVYQTTHSQFIHQLPNFHSFLQFPFPSRAITIRPFPPSSLSFVRQWAPNLSRLYEECASLCVCKAVVRLSL